MVVILSNLQDSIQALYIHFYTVAWHIVQNKKKEAALATP